MEPITERQAAVLAYIRSSVDERGFAPTHEEICEEFGWSSVGSAYGVLRRLEEAGRIRRVRHQRRGIEVVELGSVEIGTFPPWPASFQLVVPDGMGAEERAKLQAAVRDAVMHVVVDGA